MMLFFSVPFQVNPESANMESVRIFDEHRRLAAEYLKVQTEIAELDRYKKQLCDSLSLEEGWNQLEAEEQQQHQQMENRYYKDFKQLSAENQVRHLCCHYYFVPTPMFG